MRTITSIIFVLIYFQSFGQSFEIRAVNKGSGSIGIEMRETSGTGTPTTSNFVLDGVFGIRWDTAYGINLNSPTGSYNVTKSGSETVSGSFEFQAYYMNNAPFNFPANWTTNTWAEIASISVVQQGSGQGTFAICPTGFNATTNLNFNVDGVDYTPSINGEATGVTLGSSIAWDGDQNDSSWFNGANWSTGSVPTQYQEASIPASLSVYPSLSNDVNIKTLTISSGGRLSLNGNTLTIRGELSGSGLIKGSSTSELVFTGSTSSTLNMDTSQWDTTNMLQNLTVNLTGGASLTLGTKVGVIGVLTPTAGTITTGGNLRICATSASAYGQINPTGSGTISGDLTVQKALSNTSAGWRHIGLPVVGILDAIDSFAILDSNHTVAAEKNIKYWNAAPSSGNDAYGWTVPDSSFGQSYGYALYGSNSSGGKHDFDQIWSVSGTHSTGTKNFTLYYTYANGSTNNDDRGWNLVANPYASNMDATTLWTMLNGIGYKAIHIYDQINDQYKAITEAGVTIIGSASSSSSTVVAPFQAFWVKTNANTTLSFTSANQTTSATGLGTFMKNEYDLARLDVHTADSAWDQTVVYFDINGTPALDNGLDAYKLFSYNSATPNIYSVSPEGKYSINALNANNYIHSVPLGYRSSKTGQTSFSLNTTDLDAKWFVYLEDRDLGIFYDIKEKPYTFNHSNNSDSRFVLHFQTYSLSAEKLVDDVQSMKVGGDGDYVYVFVPAHHRDQTYQLEVIDMSGRVVYTDNKLALTRGMNTLNLNLNANAYYAVRIKAAEGIVSGKVQIR